MFILFFLCSLVFSESIKQTAKVGETFTIELKSNPSTGYRWSLLPSETNDSPVAELVDKHYIPGANALSRTLSGHRNVGVGGTERFTFKGLRAGTMELKFVYSRYWEDTKPEPVVYEITVN